MRISATVLESYRRWQAMEDGEQADQAEQELQAYIRGEFVPTAAITIGKAYHAILEKPQRSLFGNYKMDGCIFERSCIENMLDLIPPGLHEVKTTRELLVPGTGIVTLVAKCDHIVGSQISEFKTTLGTFKAKKYMDSVQWKVMVLLFEASLVTYYVACLRDGEDGFELRSLEQLNVWPYPVLEQDVRALLKEFCGYVKAVGLDGYLKPKANGVSV